MPRPARNFDCMLFKGMQGMHLLSIPVHLCCIIACISLLLPVPVMIQYCMGYYHTVLVLTHFNLAPLVLPQPEVSVLTELPLLLNQILCCGSQGKAKRRPPCQVQHACMAEAEWHSMMFASMHEMRH